MACPHATAPRFTTIMGKQDALSALVRRAPRPHNTHSVAARGRSSLTPAATHYITLFISLLNIISPIRRLESRGLRGICRQELSCPGNGHPWRRVLSSTGGVLAWANRGDRPHSLSLLCGLRPRRFIVRPRRPQCHSRPNSGWLSRRRGGYKPTWTARRLSSTFRR